MANPNIVNVTTINGKVVGASATTTATALVTNSSSSGKIIKINSVSAANKTTTAASITVDLYKNQTTAYKLANAITVPAYATLVVISKDTSIYLEENDSIRILGSADSTIDVVCSYEEIS